MLDAQVPQEEELENDGRGSGSRFVIWLIAFGIAALFIPLYLVSITIEEAIIPLEAELEALEATLTAPPQVPPEEQGLTDRLLALRGDLIAIENIPPTLIAAHIDWPAIMAGVLGYDANRIRLTGFIHSTTRLTIEGQAVEESAVLEYSNILENTGFFARVQVQAITLNPAPTATPGAPPTPELGSAPLRELTMPFLFTLITELNRTGDGLR